MEKQKKVLAMHDLTAMGRVALAPVMTALGAMGHQCVPVPTAVFSTHTGIEGFRTVDLTDWMGEAVAHYEGLELRFDAVLSGFLSSPAQADRVRAGAARKTPDGIFLVDPVMGDNGKIYKTYTPALVARMAELCRQADVITPNVTEAAVLLGRAPDDAPGSLDEARDWVKRLSETYGARTVMTGLSDGDTLVTLCCAGGETGEARNARVGAYYPGTGDLFAAVLLGGLLRGQALTAAAQCAADFVGACIAGTAAAGDDPRWGVRLERELWRLIP